MGHRARRADVLDLLPGGVGSGLRAFYRAAVRRAPVVYAGLYAAFFRGGRGDLRPGSAPLAALAADRLLALVARERPDAVVPVFHLAAQLTGGLRARGALPVPSTVVITDFAVHRQWLHPGNDLHLCLTPHAAREVRHAVGRPAVVTGPVVDGAFREAAPGAADWRRLLAARAP
ncbi:galactosyldiacylglycerol synthase, partial [Streptomyces sp. B1866]|nr:galactosyldiacylglycerol synthase [Streptomyces sp. B1866]